MISETICHCGIGNSGGTGVRKALSNCLSPQPKWIDHRAHLPCSHTFEAYHIIAPHIGQVRNPFDWYISTYMTELRYHRWRGGFQDWFYNRQSIPYQSLREDRTVGVWMWDSFLYFSEVEKGQGPTYTYILRAENLLNDLLYALRQLVPDRLNDNLLIQRWDNWACLESRRLWTEGIEQWMRDDFYTPEMIEQVCEQDRPIFERFGYSYEQNYYFLGGSGVSCHRTKIGDFESEKKLSGHWKVFDDPPGPWGEW